MIRAALFLIAMALIFGAIGSFATLVTFWSFRAYTRNLVRNGETCSWESLPCWINGLYGGIVHGADHRIGLEPH